MTSPIQRSLFLADYVSQDVNGGKWFAVGIYEQILCKSFPSEPRGVTGFASIGDLSGFYGADIIITGPDDSEIAKNKGGETQVQAGRVLNVSFTLHGIVFREPGKHQIKLYLNGQLAAQISVSVVQAAVHVK